MTNSKSYIPNSPLNSFIKDDLRFPPDHVRLTRIHAFSRLYSTVTLLARLRYNRNHQYIPDFVVETENVIYLVEVKGEDKMKDADVLAKKKRGVQYCRTATMWGKANGYKEWQYLFIPSKQVTPQSTFEVLCQRFAEMNTDGTSN